MKRILTLVFVLLMSVLAFTSCDSAEFGEFDIYSLDVFGVFTPEAKKAEPKDLYYDGIDNVLDAKEYELKLSLSTKYEVVGDVDESILNSLPENMSVMEYVLKETEDGFYLMESVGDSEYDEDITISMELCCVDGMAYVSSNGQKVKVEVAKEKFLEDNRIVSSLKESILKFFSVFKPKDGAFENAAVKKEGDLFILELPVDVSELVNNEDADKVDASLVAKFDKDGNLVKYIVTLIEEHEGIRSTAVYEIGCNIKDVKITAPADADTYTLETVED